MVAKPKGDLLPGTLEMLILVTLRRGPLHGYAIAQQIHQTSDDLLRRGRRIAVSGSCSAC